MPQATKLGHVRNLSKFKLKTEIGKPSVFEAERKIMPLISLDAMFKTITEQQAQIKELKEQVSQLESMLKNQNAEALTQELMELLSKYPEKLDNPIIASIDLH